MSQDTTPTRSEYVAGHNDQLQPGHDLVDYAKQYAKEKPEVVALWCFGVGFILGWKLKPW